jgi:hypothetical protein
MRLIVDEYTDRTRGESDLTLFQCSRTDQQLLLVADASETASSRAYQPLIDVVKASFVESLFHGDGPLPQRMRSACRALEQTMRERFPSSPEFGEEDYWATFVVLGVEGSHAFPLWIGSPQAKLLRGGVCIRSTIPQVTVIPKCGPWHEFPSRNTDFIVTDNSMASRREEDASVADDEPWALATGDILLLADHRLFALFSENELANLIEGAGRNKAKVLVDAAQNIEFDFARSAILARVV